MGSEGKTYRYPLIKQRIMLQKVIISNFSSIRESITVSFEATKEKTYSDDWIVKKGKFKLLKVLLFYGENGSGKTNILWALDMISQLILSDNITDLGIKPFLLNKENKHKPIQFDVFFFIGDNHYEYNMIFDKDGFLEETLNIYRKNTAIRIFKRIFDNEKGKSNVSFGQLASLNPTERKTIASNASRKESIVKVYTDINASSQVFDEIVSYFTNNYKGMVGNGYEPDVENILIKDKNAQNVVIKMLEYFHSNIIGLDIREDKHEYSEHDRLMINNLVPNAEDREKLLSRGYASIIEKSFLHTTSEGIFKLEDKFESEGTRRFVNQIVILYKAIKGCRVEFFDEFGTALNAKILELILDFFLSFSKESQIILSTHAVSLLDYEKLRRDAVQIILKDKDGGTYIETEVVRRIHKNIRLGNAYIRGLIKGIPFDEPQFNFKNNKEEWQKLLFDKDN